MHLNYRTALTGSAVALLASLGACGGDGAQPDPLEAYKSQTVAWAPCDPTILGPNSDLILILGKQVSCATIRAPLDHGDPGRGEIRLALLKVATADPAARQGSIVFNPGGPGEDGLEIAANVGTLLAHPPSASPSRAALQSMARAYDMVGFSPRGTGASTTLVCVTNEAERPVNFPSDDRSPANIEAMLYNMQLVTQACKKNPLTPYINTDQTAADLDLIRHLLGDAKLNYIGYSYGTWLGAWYAARYPERAGHLLLDSALGFTGNFDDAQVGQAVGKQRVFDQVMPPYFARHADRFQLGTDPAAISGLFGTLPMTLKHAVSARLGFGNSRHLVASGFTLLAARILRDQLAADPAIGDNDLGNALQAGMLGLVGPVDQEAALGAAWQLLNAYISIRDRKPKSLHLGTLASTYTAVVCNDVASNTDPQYWVGLGNEMALTHPVSGGSVTASYCIYWGGPNVRKPPVADVAKAGPLLIAQSQFDALTLTENALRFVEALPTARLLYVKGEYTHGLFPYMSSCLDGPVAAFFTSGAVPPRRTDCEQVPFAGDAAAAADLRRSAPDTAHTDALLDRIREIIGNAGNRGGL